LSSKLLEPLLMMIPTVSRIGVLFVPDVPVTKLQLRRIQDAARALSVTVSAVGVPEAAALDNAFSTLAQQNVGGLVVLSATLFAVQVQRIVERASKVNLPTIYPYSFYIEEGGLMSYGVNRYENFRQAARFVDRILKGARPSDLPIEQTTFESVINLKTAKAFGLNVPPNLLALADKVIE
jgi:putative tryptophan/tyrosine transport system substrate-binding protein